MYVCPTSEWWSELEQQQWPGNNPSFIAFIVVLLLSGIIIVNTIVNCYLSCHCHCHRCFHCHHPHDLGRIPVLLLLLLFSNSTQASLQPLYSHTPKLPANYISNTIRIISKLNKEERTRIDCIVIILLTLISMHKVLNDFPL